MPTPAEPWPSSLAGPEAIARTARETQATDLSQRIQLNGPRDELRYSCCPA
ncbi:hypothetical protein HNR22_001702 [Micromonospora jinlongensis]|uniref:Uncharacterized protein n=1 Tax=Micromonospora jinlongensis TaxID=1287877 RepID=A0A7Y9X025_9ACTN|nr:hypothetical protein [Micromonospora jinlongensis]